MKKGILLAIGMVVGGLGLLSGCGNQGDKTAGIPVGPKWKGLPYRLAFDTKAPKPNPAGITLPSIQFTANPDALEKRTMLVVRFDDLGQPKYVPTANKMIMPAFDISGAEGALPADYVDRSNKALGEFMQTYCVKGKVKLSVALVRSSLTNQTGDAEVDAKRLSDWLPIELTFKNPHPKC